MVSSVLNYQILVKQWYEFIEFLSARHFSCCNCYIFMLFLVWYMASGTQLVLKSLCSAGWP